MEVDILKNWFEENKKFPYANSETKRELALKTQLTEKQVYHWLLRERKKRGIINLKKKNANLDKSVRRK